MPTSICCCQQCSITFEDDFNRTNSTSIGSDWSEEVGDWSIAGSAYLTVSSNNAVAICQTEVEDINDFNLWARCYSFTSANNSDVRLIVDYVDTDNYLYFECRSSSSTSNCNATRYIKAVRRTAGAETTIATLQAGRVIHDNIGNGFHVSCRDGKLTVASGDDTFDAVVVFETITSGFVGIGTGTIGAGETIKFNDFAHAKPDDSTICCSKSNYCGYEANCTCCAGNACEDSVVCVVIDSGSLVDDVCTLCENLYGTFDVPYAGRRHGMCAWELTLPLGTTCGYTYIKVLASDTYWEVRLDSVQCSIYSFSPYYVIWRNSDAPSCIGDVGEVSIPFFLQTESENRLCEIIGPVTVEFL